VTGSEGKATPARSRILLALAVTLVLGVALKSPCASGSWTGGRAQRLLCYTDIVPLYASEGLSAGRVPYLDARNEYPVLTGAWMYLFSLPVGSPGSYFLLNAAGLALLALAVTLMLLRLVGDRAIYFAAAPVLLVYAFMNWDLLAVALATAAVVMFHKRRPVAVGVLLGLGTAAKLFPALLVIPFAWDLRRRGRIAESNRLVLAAGISWLAVDLPVALFAFHRWTYFFRYTAARGVNEGSTWFLVCNPLRACGAVAFTKILPFVTLLGGSVIVVRWTLKSRPDLPRWTIAFPLLLVVLLTTKVYSPQYDLWVLPWFALVLPVRRAIWAFQAGSMAVFLTTFSQVGANLGSGTLPLVALESAVAFRAAALVYGLVTFARGAGETEWKEVSELQVG
jgi:uncharacterized membrane protein